ncbi:MAG: autotransporter outer membrane beta-barrel domain-containing protein [Planctomycetaceae bacterium]|jgi:outer membrane autotransporter protein|nr:autotransporter outer membrane beta-barrel domain-containing protein [Planctomycetaceae bacterium]
MDNSELLQPETHLTATRWCSSAVRYFLFFILFLVCWLISSTVFSAEHFFTLDNDYYLGQKQRHLGSGGRLWTNLYYDITTLKPKDAGYKIKPDAYGLQLGFDVVQSHGVYTTFFGNIQKSDQKFGDAAKIKGDNYLFGLGKFLYLSGCHFGGAASVGYDEYKVQDYVRDTNSKGNGLQANLFGEFGIDFIFGKWGFKPFYALQYDFLYHGRIGEAETSFSSDWNGHSLNQNFGMRVNWKMVEAVELQIRASWLHEYLNSPPPFYNVRFSAVHGTFTPSVLFFSGNTGRDWALLGGGFKFEGVYNIFLFLDYDAMVNARNVSHLFNAGLCFGW